MSDSELICDFELKDGSSDWSDEILNNNQILTQECEVVNEQETDSSYSYYSEYDDEIEQENTNKKDNDIGVHDAYVLPVIEEEKVEEIEIDLSEGCLEEVVTFSIMRAQHTFKIIVPYAKSFNCILDAVSSKLGIHKEYLCLSSISKLTKEDYSKSIKELGIGNNYMLSLSFTFPVFFEEEIYVIESSDCKDLNDFYVLICQELNLPSLQLFINEQLAPTLQYPPIPLQHYFCCETSIVVKRDIIINIYYHNTELPYVYEEKNDIIKVKNNMKCVRLYKMVQDALNIPYPILIMYGNTPITPTSLTPEYCLINLKSLHVYDLYIKVPEGISLRSYTITSDNTYGKEDIVTAKLDIDTDDKDILYNFVLQFSDLTKGEKDNDDQIIISNKKCILQSTQLYSQFYSNFALAEAIPVNFVNRNYDYNHSQPNLNQNKPLKTNRNHSYEQKHIQKSQKQAQRSQEQYEETKSNQNSKRNNRSNERNSRSNNKSFSRRRSDY